VIAQRGSLALMALSVDSEHDSRSAIARARPGDAQPWPAGAAPGL